MNTTANPSPGQTRRHARWSWAVVFLAVGVAYGPALRGGFVWDDDAHVTKAALRSLHGLWRIWFELGATQQYYPILHSAFWLEHRLWGDAALGYHLTNLLLHATAACLFALVLRRLAIPAAWLGALLFAVHPVGVESVAWISEQKNTLSTVFYLLAALAYLRFERDRRPGEWNREMEPNGRTRRGSQPVRHSLATADPASKDGRSSAGIYALATLLFLLALLSKTVTATLPAALLVVLWWRKGRLSAKADVPPLVPWIGLGAAAGLFSAWVERKYIGAQGAAFSLDAAQRCLLAGRALWFYLCKLLWPANLIFIYPHWRIEVSERGQLLFPLAAAALIAALWLIRRRTRAPLAGILFFAGSLFPALGFVNVYPFVFSYVADHFQYLASLGIFALAAGGMGSWARMSGAAGRGAALAVLCVLGTLTWRQCLIYRNAETLYRTTLERNPASWLAHLNLGNILWESGRTDEAVAHYEESLHFNPDYADTHFDLGKALMQSGRTSEAAVQFGEVLRLNPNDAEAHNNLGVELGTLGRMTEAVAQFEESLRLRPDNAKAHNNLGVALRALGRNAEAQAQFEQSVQLGGGR